MFKNLGIPPPLRSLVVIHPALSSSVSVQLRMRLRLSSQSASSSALGQRRIHTTSLRLSQSSPSSSSSAPARTSTESEQADPQEPRLSLTFTCTVTDCDERSTHQFTRRAYERGIVLVTCPKCKNRYVVSQVYSGLYADDNFATFSLRHLIADHLGWFKETEGTNDGQLKTIEDLVRAKGEIVKRGRLDAGGVVEYV